MSNESSVFFEKLHSDSFRNRYFDVMGDFETYVKNIQFLIVKNPNVNDNVVISTVCQAMKETQQLENDVNEVIDLFLNYINRGHDKYDYHNYVVAKDIYHDVICVSAFIKLGKPNYQLQVKLPEINGCPHKQLKNITFCKSLVEKKRRNFTYTSYKHAYEQLKDVFHSYNNSSYNVVLDIIVEQYDHYQQVLNAIWYKLDKDKDTDLVFKNRVADIIFKNSRFSREWRIVEAKKEEKRFPHYERIELDQKIETNRLKLPIIYNSGHFTFHETSYYRPERKGMKNQYLSSNKDSTEPLQIDSPVPVYFSAKNKKYFV